MDTIKKPSKKTVRIELKLMGGEGSVIPKNISEVLRIEVTDGLATFKFNNRSITKAFALSQKKDGVESVYSDRLQKTICKYPNMTQEDIVKHLKSRLEVLKKKKEAINNEVSSS